MNSTQAGRSPSRVILVVAFCLVLHNLSSAVTFAATEIASGDQGSTAVASGDFDGDGIPDLVTANYYTISFYKGVGDGTYAAPLNFSPDIPASGISAADFNRDGKLDIATVSDSGIETFLGHGDGTFAAGIMMYTNLPSTSLALADFNGDHIPDVALITAPPYSNCQVEIYLGQGDGSFAPGDSHVCSAPFGSAIVAGDFNADGRQDLAVAQGSEVDVYLGEENGEFQDPLVIASQQTPVALAVGDFFNNRIDSLAVMSQGSYNGKDALYVNSVQDVNGQLVATTPQLALKKFYIFGPSIAAGDLNGDFKDDIVITTSYVPPQLGIYPFTGYMLGEGNGAFHAMVKETAHSQNEWTPFIRDLNLDSRHDVGIDWNDAGNNGGGGAMVLLNTNAKTNCAPPPANKLSVNICAPADGQTIGQTFTFRGAGNSLSGIAKRVELWIDGKKAGQNLEDQLKVTTKLASGTHTATFIVVDSFDDIAKKSVTFAVR
jgi:hypothetical protein